ncbi:PP2C family protein-serine/threonine phosphatase [Nonomuraea rhizosphaerae]|uniref:PP2C family protein-serine/threonine phosphatase n=1 Tax=Nonomuraea rhizosphaerae TaxID=2665663 RepID=UPI001C605913|nr:protein phosphatase 2C domain-containing protein [Nonomuraea rhizosphaerae]
MAGLTCCSSCGGTVAPDGHCWDCGAAQPAFRSHLEITTGDGTGDGTGAGQGEGDGAAGVSDRGRRRGVNADAMALATSGSWTIGVVCDGVSMSPRADRAARVAAETGAATLVARLRAGVLPEVALGESAVRAGHAVAALATSINTASINTAPVNTAPVNPTSVNAAPINATPINATPADAASLNVAPACTYVAGIAGPDGIWAGWVGDSRAYWLPDEGLGMALTEDDSTENETLSAWLGADAGEPEARVRSYRPRGPGRLLLCTDGLWRYLPDADGLSLHCGGGGLLEGARSLVGHALDAGGHDNITALLIPVPGAVRRPL